MARRSRFRWVRIVDGPHAGERVLRPSSGRVVLGAPVPGQPASPFQQLEDHEYEVDAERDEARHVRSLGFRGTDFARSTPAT